MKVNILVFGSDNFNKSLDELKEKLQFNLIIYDSKAYLQNTNLNYHLILVDNKFITNFKKKDLIKFDTFKLPILLLVETKDDEKDFLIYNKIYFPFNVLDFKKKINELITSYKFNINSSIKIKNYIVDKNLKLLKKDKVSINLTEKEIDLLLLLYEEKQPLNKNIILKKIWKYSSDADTHTVETHIYRLRKKVLDKFEDRDFINIFKEGYSL